jgi:two-component system phosphate regulon sensor histidine kinase PhoR
MAAGDLDVRVRIEPGDDEVARVGRALNQLADATRDTIRRLDEEGRLVRTILESMREGVMALDGSGRVTLVNQAMIDTCAFPPGALGRPAAELIRAPEVLQAVAEAADGRAVSREVHVALPRPATLLVNASPLREGGALLVVHDTTELHRLHQVRRDFVANVSHELRNPVATIQAAVETLADLRPDPDPDERRLLETVTRQSARMAALVRDLLSLARIESGQLELHPRALDLGQELQALVSPFDAPARAKELELVVEPAPGTPPVLADPEALQTVLGNLVDNAVKYARPGDRVLVRVRPGEPGWVEIEVSDTGPGIDAIHLPRLFERFYRVDAGRSREVGGTGLGLALVKHLAAAMGGKVQVRSTPGRGATFTVTLPAAG